MIAIATNDDMLLTEGGRFGAFRGQLEQPCECEVSLGYGGDTLSDIPDSCQQLKSL